MGCNEIIPENDHAQIMEYCTCILYYLWDSRFLFEIPIDLGRFPLDPLLCEAVKLSSTSNAKSSNRRPLLTGPELRRQFSFVFGSFLSQPRPRGKSFYSSQRSSTEVQSYIFCSGVATFNQRKCIIIPHWQQTWFNILSSVLACVSVSLTRMRKGT